MNREQKHQEAAWSINTAQSQHASLSFIYSLIHTRALFWFFVLLFFCSFSQETYGLSGLCHGKLLWIGHCSSFGLSAPVPSTRHQGQECHNAHTTQNNTTQHNTTQHNTIQHAHHNTTQHNTTQYNTHTTTQHNTTQHATHTWHEGWAP